MIVDRSDFMAVFQGGGAEALNQLLQQRLPKTADRLAELSRMERRGGKVAWDDEGDDGQIVGHKQV